jgi:hypothetical protein
MSKADDGLGRPLNRTPNRPRPRMVGRGSGFASRVSQGVVEIPTVRM